MPAFPLLQRAWNRLRASVAPVPDISAALWLNTLGQYPFLAALTLPEQAKLRALAALFLQRKEFTGAHGLEVTDAMAVAIAAQACLPLLHLGAPRDALAWYDDFVGIVVHPGDALARRITTVDLPALARAGEATGDIGGALSRCADQLEFEERMRNEAREALKARTR